MRTGLNNGGYLSKDIIVLIIKTFMPKQFILSGTSLACALERMNKKKRVLSLHRRVWSILVRLSLNKGY